MTSKRLTIGVLSGQSVYNFGINQFLAALFRGLDAAAQKADCHLLFGCGISKNVWPDISSDENGFVPIGPWNTDGLIVVLPLASDLRSEYIHALRQRGHPVVFIGANELGPWVAPDNAEGIYEAMEHLVVEHGHRKIAFLAGMKHDLADSAERAQAYRDALSRHGLPEDERLIVYGGHIWNRAQEATRRLIESGVEFTALLASNDISARAAIDVLRQNGRRVPQDVAVIGFDDQADARGTRPSLTTIHHPLFEVGYKSLALLLQVIVQKTPDQPPIRIPTRLVVRQSCGCTLTALRAIPNLLELAKSIYNRILPEMSYFDSGELLACCENLTQAWFQSVQNINPNEFEQVLGNILLRTEELADDVHIWQAAISVLRDVAEPDFVDWLDSARIVISEHLRQQYNAHALQRWSLDEVVGGLTARFLAVEDEGGLVKLLDEDLPETGVQHVRALLFEPDAADPVAWSVPLGDSPTRQRFETRSFPPPGLYPEGERLTLGIVPLLIQGKIGQLGYATFGINRVSLYPLFIAEHLAAAIKTLRLYHEAAEGRRLAEEADRQKSRFLSTVSHELRTPLSIIVGLSEMLMRSPASTSAEDIQRIHASARHLGWLIRDVLDLASSQVGHLRLFEEPLNLAQVLHPAIETSAELAREKGLAWRCDMPSSPLWVWGDRARLSQVVLNLASNAVKFTSRGGVTVRVEPSEQWVTISVQDTGLGIPAAAQAMIFDEFQQAEHTSRRGFGGLGLGLAISKRLVEMHGGKISVHSDGVEGSGSTFSFTLPLLAPARIPIVPEAPAEETARQKNRVLVLWADAQTGASLQAQLQTLGLDSASHSLEETDAWFADLLETPTDIVVLDSPQTSARAWAVFQQLKEHPVTRDIPLLFHAPDTTGRFLELDYLSKPLASASLADALNRYGLLGNPESKTILVIDDDPGILRIHAQMLQTIGIGYRILQAPGGREGMAIAQNENVDLILLDLMMPEMDGFAVLDALRSGTSTRNIPVIVLTAQILSEADMARLNRGVVSVLAKGVFTGSETLQLIQAALQRNRKSGSEAQRLVRRAIAYIHTHYRDDITREDMAAAMGVNESYLARCFQQELNIPPMTYLMRHRINQAKHLLAQSDESITSVAMTVGFSGSDYFSRVFRQEVGVSPRAYRQGERPQ